MAVGTQALLSNTVGTENVGIGFQALSSNVGDLMGGGNDNTAVGFQALLSNTEGSSNTAVGDSALSSNTEGTSNTAVGVSAMTSNTVGLDDTALGAGALSSNTEGQRNTAVGEGALRANTGNLMSVTGSFNTAVGTFALSNNTTGNGNIAIGDGAGSSLNTGSNNIDIANGAPGDESNTIRIGTGQTKTFIAGIAGVMESSPTGVVTINANGQLGVTPFTTVISSRRFKKEIKSTDKVSEAILALKPVTFQYKSDDKRVPQFGLIAEEVAAVNPDLIVRDDKGEIYSVRYDAVNAMLLNEFLKEHKAFLEEHRTVEELKKQVAALTAGLQKVSAQLEVGKAAPQTVLNNQ